MLEGAQFTSGQSCINVVVNRLNIDFTLSNPSTELISVFTAAGADNCALAYNFDASATPPGFTSTSATTRTRAQNVYVQAPVG